MPFLQNKLKALNYPRYAVFDPSEPKEIRALVIWLEGTKIAFYSEAKRTDLVTVELPGWNKVFYDYARALGCPLNLPAANSEQVLAVIDWVVAHAVMLEYRNNAAAYNSSVDSFMLRLSRIKYDDEKFVEIISNIAKSLGVEVAEGYKYESEGDRAGVLIKGLCRVLRRRFGDAGAGSQSQSQPTIADLADSEAYPVGFDTANEELRKAATILRLLYIADLRELQTAVNELIVEMQLITANPLTDSRLGKVGR